MDEIKYTPILPFDVTYGETLTMYDNMTYVRDVALCDETCVKMESGNVLKFFRCAAQEPVKIGGDENTKDIIDAAIEKHLEYVKAHTVLDENYEAEDADKSHPDENKETEDDIAALLKDNDK